MTAHTAELSEPEERGGGEGGGARSLGLVAPLSKQCVCQSVRADRCVGQSVQVLKRYRLLYVTMRLSHLRS